MQVEQHAPVFGQDFNAFMTYLREGSSPMLSPARYGEVMHLDAQTLAQSAQVHRNTLRRAPQSATVQGFLRDSVRVLRAATDLHGSVEEALFWFSNHPLAVFDYKTAHTLVTERRTEALLRYLASLDAGFAG
jgi:uncharacterized protein (DUF2384 family)